MLSQNQGWNDKVIEHRSCVNLFKFRRNNMPCRTDDPTPNEIRNAHEQEFLHNSTLAEIFCSVMLKLEAMDEGFADPFIGQLPMKAQKWWAEHVKRDREKVNAERIAMERDEAIEQALNKLTPAERKLLGVKRS